MKVSYNLLPDYVNVARNIAETLNSRNWRVGEYFYFEFNIIGSETQFDRSVAIIHYCNNNINRFTVHAVTLEELHGLLEYNEQLRTWYTLKSKLNAFCVELERKLKVTKERDKQ